ncbi:DUF4178 domain-containing protein [Jannaschia aquimarina]|uniref:DUF4178 domain-containing protein n=1 Tax=Jannaschia aquimarina TaxID=935700 RepID=A0A0D1CTD8_9RHOB|nr:DUF4178 domain-containing protein [Jannaschia aquimarina]KIT18032.1 hypothetical protein jaqu_01570 [Jannaschia aquimarina]SNS88915.1 protein of unknown function [Jannaschia aquimarina]
MTRSGDTRAINCTNCGAGLPVLGGGRVVTQVCSYCGAQLDANDAYKVLAVFAGMERPETPFALGQTGHLKGADWTIVGTIGMVERYKSREWRWTDHQLYSPTHGYAWLTVEDGHLLFTRKVRDWPAGSWLTSAAVERSESPPSRNWRGRPYRYYATSDWVCDFVEGEFTYRPEKGDRGRTISLMPFGNAHDMLAYVSSGQRENEVEVTTYAPEAAEAFGVEAPRPQGVHPLQPFEAKPGSRFYPLWFGGMAAAAFASIFVMLAMRGDYVDLGEGPLDALPIEAEFEVANAARPVQLRLNTDSSNNWAAFEIAITGPDGTPVAETFREVDYYHGRSGGESWSEGSRRATLGFQPVAAGPHRVTVDLEELGRDQGTVSRIEVQMREGLTTIRWVLGAFVVFAIALAFTASARLRHRMRRWAGSDWTEED